MGLLVIQILNAVFDLASGELLWRRREGGAKVDAKLKNSGAAGDAAAAGTAATGVVLGSMTFVDGKACGIKYVMGGSEVEVVVMDRAAGPCVIHAMKMRNQYQRLLPRTGE